MAEQITKKVLEDVLDKKFGAYQASIIEAVDYKFQRMEEAFDYRFQKIEAEMSEMRTEIRNLTTTLDNFLKRMTDYEDEFKILNAEMAQVKKILKEKLGVEVSLYN